MLAFYDHPEATAGSGVDPQRCDKSLAGPDPGSCKLDLSGQDKTGRDKELAILIIQVDHEVVNACCLTTPAPICRFELSVLTVNYFIHVAWRTKHAAVHPK